MHSTRRFAGAALAMTLAATGACGKKPVQVSPTPTTTTTTTTTTTSNAADLAAQMRADSARQAEQLRAQRETFVRDSIRNAAAAASASVAEAARLKETLLTMVHFDYDLADLREDTKAALDLKIAILKSNPTVTLTIAGHADDRGSDEHNMALGVRRAASAKQYLIDHGIAESRLQTTSYGEEKPLCQRGDESCHAQNRRAEFQITAGPATLKR